MSQYRILLPLRKTDPQADLVTLAAHLLPEEGGLIELMGVVVVASQRSLSEAAVPAQEMRESLLELAKGFPHVPLHVKPRVRVAHVPWLDIVDELRDERVDLLLLSWDDSGATVLGAPLKEVLTRSPCDLIVSRGMVHRYDRVLVPIRGGPHIGLVLRLAKALHRVTGEEITLLAVTSKPGPLPALQRLQERVPFAANVVLQPGDPVRVIRRLATDYHALVLGATLQKGKASPLGRVPTELIRQTPLPIFLVRSFRPGQTEILEPVSVAAQAEEKAASPLSDRVDRWFATNTFHWNEFRDIQQLLRWKEERGRTISLVLPALNEEATIGSVIASVKGPLMEEYPLLDEIIVMDSDSSDATRQVAASLGVPVYIHQQVLAKEAGARVGKGEALWKSLYVTKGDIIAWIDTDIVNIHPRFVVGVLGPLLRWDRIQYVKGFYRRPLHAGSRTQVSGGGRVTELVARPLLNLFFPELSGIVQPLSGEYAGRRQALERLPFFTGYGVETGLLLDLLQEFGLSAVAQCNLEMRTHRSQPLPSLSKMAFAILQVVAARLEGRAQGHLLDAGQRTMKTISYEPGRFCLDEQEITEQERPPIVNEPAYRARFGRE